MSAFVSNDITKAGLTLLAKGQIGEQIKYTRIVLGDGYMPPDMIPRDMTGIVHEVVSLDIIKCKIIGDGTVVIGGYFTNAEMPTGFFYRELALYAEDPDDGEILYCYGNAGDLAEWIPPNGTMNPDSPDLGYSTIVEKTVDIVTIVGAAANVTAVLSSGAFATYSELLEVQKQVESAADALEKIKELIQSTNDVAYEELQALRAEAQKGLDEIREITDRHTNDYHNPHKTTYKQVGADPEGSADAAGSGSLNGENSEIVIRSGRVSAASGTVTFKTAFDVIPNVTLTPMAITTASSFFYVTAVTLTGFTYGGNVANMAWIAVSDDSE